MIQMKDNDIETRPGFYTPSKMLHIYDCPQLPICEGISNDIISLPTFTTLQNEEIGYISEKLLSLRT